MRVDAAARAAARSMPKHEKLVLGGLLAGLVAIGAGVVVHGRRERPTAALSADLIREYDRGGKNRDRAITLGIPPTDQASELVTFQRDQSNGGDWFGSGVWWEREQLFRDADKNGMPDGRAEEAEVEALLLKYDRDNDLSLTWSEQRAFHEAYPERRADPPER